MKPRKQTFEVGANESVSDCLTRMDQQGYLPTRRMEKPVFEQQGKKEPVWLKQQIVFEGVLKNNENEQA